MKISVDYNDVIEEIITIETAKYVGNFQIQLLFNDGNLKVVDFKNFLNKSLHPSLKKYLEETFFSNFQLVDGNLNWNDYEMIFPVADLYAGEII